jgi:hypothetical protein
VGLTFQQERGPEAHRGVCRESQNRSDVFKPFSLSSIPLRFPAVSAYLLCLPDIGPGLRFASLCISKGLKSKLWQGKERQGQASGSAALPFAFRVFSILAIWLEQNTEAFCLPPHLSCFKLQIALLQLNMPGLDD